MKAAVITGFNSMELKEVPVPEVEPVSILIKIITCAVCGSDVRILDSGNPRVKYPAIIGHEISGEVIDIGKEVKGFKIGDKLAVGADVPCGKCYWCLNGMGNCCDENYAMGYQFQGGFAEYCLIGTMVVKYGPICKIPDGVDMDHAALAEPLACCINGMEQTFFKEGKSILVIGAGAIGLLLIQLARTFGGSLSILTDIDSERLKHASISSPDYAINSKNVDLIDKVMDITKGKGVDVVFTACASKEAQEQAIKVVSKRGVVNFFGGLPANAGNINICSNDIHYREIYLTGSHGSTPSHHALAMELIASGRIDVSKLITHMYSLNDIKEAFETVRKRQGLKVVVRP